MYDYTVCMYNLSMFYINYHCKLTECQNYTYFPDFTKLRACTLISSLTFTSSTSREDVKQKHISS